MIKPLAVSFLLAATGVMAQGYGHWGPGYSRAPLGTDAMNDSNVQLNIRGRGRGNNYSYRYGYYDGQGRGYGFGYGGPYMTPYRYHYYQMQGPGPYAPRQRW